MDLQLLKTFLTVLEVGNYSNAAIHLDYAQSTITSHIQKLESAYGGLKLLERKGNLMIPTAPGEILKEYANQLIQLYEKSKNEIIGQKQQKIKIGTINSLANTYLPIIIPKMKNMYPDISIQLFNGNTKLLHSMLKNNSLDMMFIIDTNHEFNGFNHKQIKKEDFIILIYKDHPLAKKTSVSFDDIKNEQFILTENGCNYRKLLLDEFAKNNYTPKISMELGSIESIKQAILDKCGIGFLPSFLVKHSDSLIPLKFKSKHSNFYSQVVYIQNDKCTPSFIDEIIKFISNYTI